MAVKKVIRIGTAGWNVSRDAAVHFPADGSHLERYAAILNCAEINSSFYRPHKKKTWERWRESVPADFRFSVKAPKIITHETRLNCGPEILEAFVDQIDGLRAKLGPVLFQLPPSFEFNSGCVKRFLTQLRSIYSGDVVWEPRHPSWFGEEVGDLLTTFKIARVAASPACVPAAGKPGGNAALAYFRLHGEPRKYFSSYSESFINSLAEDLVAMNQTGDVWCIFDNTGSGAAIENALQLGFILQKFLSPS